ncbi:MAG: MarR family transcriptional regulator [Actinobacteria bacterium]|nr:MarR family transcriptional regulator [Actinomycetota bacterium]
MVPQSAKSISAKQLDAWIAFLRAHRRVLEHLEAELRGEHGLSLSEYEVLLHLSRAPRNRLRMGELAANVLVTPSGLTRLADRMADAGLIARRPCPEDRRVSYLVLTAAGRKRFEAAAPTHVRGVQEHFAGYLGGDTAAVLAALSRIAGP